MSEQNQILRLLATLREESAEVRRRQEELFELLISYKDQIAQLQQTVVEKLSGLPKSPYIAGQLVPAPHKVDGVDDYRELLATYLHKGAQLPSDDDPAERPTETVYEPPAPVNPDTIELEDDDDTSDERPRRRNRQRSGPRDNDLERGPDRDVEPFDLTEDEDEDDDEESGEGDDEGDEAVSEGASSGDEERGRRGRRRRGRRRRGGRGRGKAEASGGGGGEPAAGGS